MHDEAEMGDAAPDGAAPAQQAAPSTEAPQQTWRASTFAFSDGSAPEAAPVRQAAAPAAPPAAVDAGRPDLDGDRMGAANRARAQSSSIFG